MSQLLSIKRIPIEIEVNVSKAELKPIDDRASKPAPQVSVSRRNDALLLRADPVQFDLTQGEPKKFDSFTKTQTGHYQGFTLNYRGYARVEEDDEGTAPQGGGQSDLSFRAGKASRSIESVLSSLPKVRNNTGVSFSNGKLSIDYKVDGDMPDITELMKDRFEFIPGKIEVIVTQMPRLEIEYLGDPIYFPKSANPNYEPAVEIFA